MTTNSSNNVNPRWGRESKVGDKENGVGGEDGGFDFFRKKKEDVRRMLSV